MERSRVRTSSAAMTPATPFVVDISGRERASTMTKTQNVGAPAAKAVSSRASDVVISMTRRRPCRSASRDIGRAAIEARRMTPRPSPRVVPDSPTCCAIDAPAPGVRSPNPAAMSGRAAVAANCEKPA